MKLKRAFVLLNRSEPSIFPDLSQYHIVCAIDGAYNYFESDNVVSDLVTGDFEKALQILKYRGLPHNYISYN